MSKIETRQISEVPVRFETAIEMHHYVSGSGWWRMSVVGFGPDATKATAAAKDLVEQCGAACVVSSVELSHRVPLVTESAEG